jgi:hypothetical protein
MAPRNLHVNPALLVWTSWSASRIRLVDVDFEMKAKRDFAYFVVGYVQNMALGPTCGHPTMGRVLRVKE